MSNEPKVDLAGVDELVGRLRTEYFSQWHSGDARKAADTIEALTAQLAQTADLAFGFQQDTINLAAQLAEARTALIATGGAAATRLKRAMELEAQLAEARDKALEEAAAAYEAETHTWTAWPEAGAARRKGAKAIRALKGSQQ